MEDHLSPLESNLDNESAAPRRRKNWIAPFALLLVLTGSGVGLAVWKSAANASAEAAAANQPEPMEAVSVAIATEREHRRTSTVIGSVLALRSITLRNEVPGTVREVSLQPGAIVEKGTVLVALDVSVEEAELKAREAEVVLAEALLARMNRAVESRAVSEMEQDRARAELDVAKASIDRIRAVIDRKTIRAPFRARMGISDVHEGQYLVEGSLLTTLQGVDDSVHVDFSVPQQMARWLEESTPVEILSGIGSETVNARIVALDSRFDPVTRNTTVRALVADSESVPPPGASVRVRVPVGRAVTAVSVPVSSLRKGPGGDHVFVVAPDDNGGLRAHTRRVEAGPVLGDEVMILSGIVPGEQVATDGSFKLRESALVAVARTNNASVVHGLH